MDGPPTGGKGEALYQKFLALPDGKCGLFDTFDDSNWIILMLKNDIVEMLFVHQNYPIWVIKSAKNVTFSL